MHMWLMTYCITVFGTVSKTCSVKLFKIQKHCIRILFGDLENTKISLNMCTYHDHLKHRNWEQRTYQKLFLKFKLLFIVLNGTQDSSLTFNLMSTP